MNNYDDIINLEHHVSQKYPHMSLEARSAQFSPFSALTGYNDAIKETERLTFEKRIILEEQRNILNNKLQILNNEIKNKPEIIITHFIPDKKKSGGLYKTEKVHLKKINLYKRELVLENNKRILFENIYDLKCKLFDVLE